MKLTKCIWVPSCRLDMVSNDLHDLVMVCMGHVPCIKGEFTNEEMLEYLQRLYMHEGMTPTFENIETPCITCIDIEYV